MSEKQKNVATGCLFIWWWHHNIWLHSAVVGHASLSCPVLLIWPVYRAGAVMSVTPTPLPMWTDRPLSHTSVRTHRVWCVALFVPHTHTRRPTPAYVSTTFAATAGQRGQICWTPAPGGNDRFRGCCGRRWTEAGLWGIFVTCNMQRRRGVMTSSV